MQETPLSLQNTFALLSAVHFPTKFGSDEGECYTNAFIHSPGAAPFVLKRNVFSRMFTLAWVQFLKCKLPAAVYKKILIFLPKKVLPHLNDPLVLTDFLTDSYNVGGIVSLLALNGIFYLIQNFNLEYPEFFNKLYGMFTYEILMSKFQARFFFLSDLFLSSTHLPAYLVAAFVKRLARLALRTPVNITLIILPFIKNLMIRHPSLEILIHSPDKEVLTADPYDPDEPNPAKCHALESSLWEVKSLQSHWNPEVSKKAKFVNSRLPQMEWDFSDQLENTIMDMAEKELSKNSKEIPAFYDEPAGFFERKEDIMNSLWTL